MKKRRELKVVFDTNALFNKSEHYLLSHDVYELITESARHNEIDLTWVLPEIVRHERQVQMFKVAAPLTRTIAKLESLLGQKLNITQEIIEEKIIAGIDSQAADLGIQIIPLDTAKVDWGRLILDSAFRKPPFDPEKEKGFRDAVVAETLLQVVSSIVEAAPNCIVAFVCGDKLLKEAITGRTVGIENVRILDGIEELKSLINTLISEASEEYVASITPRARAVFYQPGNNHALYFTGEISRRIKQEFASQLAILPPGADTRKNPTFSVQEPTFLRKEGQRVHWVSRIKVHAQAFKTLDPQVFTLGDFTKSPPTAASFAELAESMKILEEAGVSLGFRKGIQSIDDNERLGDCHAGFAGWVSAASSVMG